jgi:hypothetical protein
LRFTEELGATGRIAGIGIVICPTAADQFGINESRAQVEISELRAVRRSAALVALDAHRLVDQGGCQPLARRNVVDDANAQQPNADRRLGFVRGRQFERLSIENGQDNGVIRQYGWGFISPIQPGATHQDGGNAQGRPEPQRGTAAKSPAHGHKKTIS